MFNIRQSWSENDAFDVMAKDVLKDKNIHSFNKTFSNRQSLYIMEAFNDKIRYSKSYTFP